MGEEPFDNLRLSLMQDVLPVGLAMMERVRKGEVGKLLEDFTDSGNLIRDLRTEGEPAAKSFRERLDKVSPGLGNPVMPVKVAVDSNDLKVDLNADAQSLMKTLTRIEKHLGKLEQYLEGNFSEEPGSSSDQG